MVHLIEAGYSHAEIAEMMGYAGARSVTTTMNRVRTKIVEHVGGRKDLDELMIPTEHLAQMVVMPIIGEEDLEKTDGDSPGDGKPTQEDS